MKKDYLYHAVVFIIWVTLNVGTDQVPALVKTDKFGALKVILATQPVAVHQVKMQVMVPGDEVVKKRAQTGGLQGTIQQLENQAKARIDQQDTNDPVYLFKTTGFRESQVN